MFSAQCKCWLVQCGWGEIRWGAEAWAAGGRGARVCGGGGARTQWGAAGAASCLLAPAAPRAGRVGGERLTEHVLTGGGTGLRTGCAWPECNGSFHGSRRVQQARQRVSDRAAHATKSGESGGGPVAECVCRCTGAALRVCGWVGGRAGGLRAWRVSPMKAAGLASSFWCVLCVCLCACEEGGICGCTERGRAIRGQRAEQWGWGKA